jgi:hypothetical protein
MEMQVGEGQRSLPGLDELLLVAHGIVVGREAGCEKAILKWSALLEEEFGRQ